MNDNQNWTPCPVPTPDDIIRWTEPVWAPPSKKRGKPDAIGEQRITAAVLDVGDTVELKVREVEQIALDEGASLKVKPGDIIRRKPESLAKGTCEKLT